MKGRVQHISEIPTFSDCIWKNFGEQKKDTNPLSKYAMYSQSNNNPEEGDRWKKKITSSNVYKKYIGKFTNG